MTTRSLQTLFAQGIAKLQELNEPFALCGALATIPFYPTPRATKDIDFVIATKNPENAIRVISELNLTPNPIRRAELDGGPLFAVKNKSSPVAVVIGKDPAHPDAIGLDILLGSNIWVPSAVDRAQGNVREILGQKLPVITPEDLLLTKLITYSKKPDRKSDLQDIRVLLRNVADLDWTYLTKKSAEYSMQHSDILFGKLSPEEQALLNKLHLSRKRSK